MICVGSADSGTPGDRPGRGGANPTSTLFRKSDWWVAEIPYSKAKELVQRWHYAGGGSNTRVYSHGLFPKGCLWESECVGVAWWLAPTKGAAQSFDSNWRGVLSLSRLAIAPDVPKNAASYLIRRSMSLIDRERWPVLVTYADDWQGHEGKIYEAAGWFKVGKTKPEKRYVKDGRMVSRKAGPKTRTHAEMLALGYECVGAFSATRFEHRLEFDMEPKPLTTEAWREYDFGGRIHRIENPAELYIGTTTHRVVDSEGIVHCVPAPGHQGCVLRWKPKDPAQPVQF